MKREALNHPKMLDFASRLDIPRAHAVGILTLLFDFTAAYAPQGDIGKHRDGAIARACDWMGCPVEFITALVESGWIDRDGVYRLIVHDWSEHCENWVKAKLLKMELGFAVSSTPESALKSTSVATGVPTEMASQSVLKSTPERSPSRDPDPDPDPNPDLANPSLAQPSTTETPPEATDVAEVCGGILKAWNLAMEQDCKLTDKRLKALKQRLKDPFWAEHWREAIVKATESDFCNGLGDKGWKADFEWFVRPDSVVKLVEGKYENRKTLFNTYAAQRVSNSERAMKEFASGE